ncbi:Methyltransferase-like protein 22 [Lunasporangiospora selenospora]|uniref:Methyltransferase-like protein 22 n=1 Tax=Lunasporangiospora selenospora TaxID=979761 RepID=A0A9P6G337_9FUNG|nr:Methyltransferase-like protein 22 [Lunasporangiospora selenospora]
MASARRTSSDSSDRDDQPPKRLKSGAVRGTMQLHEHARESSDHDANDDDAREDEIDSGEDCSQEDMLLSEVHIHPGNGRVDGRLISSTFRLSKTARPGVNNVSDATVVVAKTIEATLKPDGENDVHSDESDDPWDYYIDIQHTMGSTLRGVGSQVWMGSFLMTDYLVSLGDKIEGAIAIELGAGTGIASIAAGLLSPIAKIFCTDFDTAVLENCQSNIVQSCSTYPCAESSTLLSLEKRVLPKRLNWLAHDPFDCSLTEEIDPFSWTLDEIEEWKQNGAFIFASDVVYDDSLTDALIGCLEKLLTISLPKDHPRHEEGRVAYISMEKRYNFSLNELDIVAQAHDYFVKKMGLSKVLKACTIDKASIDSYCDYSRTEDLVLFEVTCRELLDLTKG